MFEDLSNKVIGTSRLDTLNGIQAYISPEARWTRLSLMHRFVVTYMRLLIDYEGFLFQYVL